MNNSKSLETLSSHVRLRGSSEFAYWMLIYMDAVHT